jgi:hypothetical protein
MVLKPLLCPESLLKTQIAGPHPEVQDSVGLDGWGRGGTSVFLTSSQVILMPLVYRPHCGSHWPWGPFPPATFVLLTSRFSSCFQETSLAAVLTECFPIPCLCFVSLIYSLAHGFIHSMTHYLFHLLVYFHDTEVVQTQGFELASQALYHLNHSACSYIVLGIFKLGSHKLFAWSWP